MGKSTKPELVEITWFDIFGKNDGWTDLEEWTDPGHAQCKTLGYLLPDLKDGYVCVAGTIMSMEGKKFFHDINYIPTGAVQKIKKVSLSKR